MTNRKKKSLKHAFEECKDLYEPDEIFEPQYSDFRYWFNFINKVMFDNSLDFPDQVEIKRLHKRLGEASGFTEVEDDHRIVKTEIRIHNRFTDIDRRHLKASAKQMFINTMAHEMVHLAQYQSERKMNHGASFKKWANEFKKIGIKL